VDRWEPRDPGADQRRSVAQAAQQPWRVETGFAPADAPAGVQANADRESRRDAVSFDLAFKEAELLTLRSRFLRQQRSLLGKSASGSPPKPCRR